MPASNMSRISTRSTPRSDTAAQIAQVEAKRIISERIANGSLNIQDKTSFNFMYQDIYRQEYYKYYAVLQQQQEPVERIVYKYETHPAATKFPSKHTVANFSRSNCFIHVHKGCITIGKIERPFDSIDGDTNLDAKEACLEDWPGPLDRHDDHLKSKLIVYVDSLWRHDMQRRIKYCNTTNDQHRRIILELFTTLLHRDGSIDATAVTTLLLRSDQTDIQKDEGKPLERLQKYLLLGQRDKALKHAVARELWDHAMCLTFLNRYQPPYSGDLVKVGPRLRDEQQIQVNDKYINKVDYGILNIVYRSLLNRILLSEPESSKSIKHYDVGNDFYRFAMLSANDCEMEFDQSNEIFKLIVAIKKTISNPAISSCHLIALGHTTADGYEPNEDFSFQSHISFGPGDTNASRTLTISNIDMLILNEIWEYCLNLARGTCNPMNYCYMINLVPYKLVFAARLLDLGEYEKFANYLHSIRNALSANYPDRDPYYDWDTIERSVESLSQVWHIIQVATGSQPEEGTALPNMQPSHSGLLYNPPSQQQTYNPIQQNSPSPLIQNESRTDYIGSSSEYPSLPYQDPSTFNAPILPRLPYNIPPPLFNQPPIPEEVTDFSPDVPDETDANYNYSNQPSRRPSTDAPIYSQQSYGQPSAGPRKPISSSSPQHRESLNSMGESFNAFSPINQFEDGYSKREFEPQYNRGANSSTTARSSDVLPPPNVGQRSTSGLTDMTSGASSSGPAGTNNNARNNEQSTDPQQPGFIANLVGSARALLPKTNSKQMILPDDSSKTIVYDDKRGTWVDTTKPEGEDADDLNGPPPMMASKPPASYSFANKSAKTRYPKAPF